MSYVFDFKNVRTVHIEPTTNCNAACPQCIRTRTVFEPSELSLDDVKRLLPPEIVSNLEKVYMCGNYGDPASAKQTIEMYEYFKSVNPNIVIGMNSNGGVRSTDWWTRLAKVMTGKNDYVVFSIDGLEDTNHIYRVNVRWSKIMENATAFISNGGNAHWDMLMFEHNKHQVESAERLAKEMGFKWFRVKVSRRFKRFPVDGLSAPLNFTENIVSEGSISCSAIKDSGIYIDAHGRLLPCCWQVDGIYNNDIVKWFHDLSSNWDSNPDPTCKKSCLTNNKITTFNGQWRYEKEFN